MALVAYDCSDDSGNENEEDEVPVVIEEVRKLNVKPTLDPSKIHLSDEEDEIIASSSKSFLPAPVKSQPTISTGINDMPLRRQLFYLFAN